MENTLQERVIPPTGIMGTVEEAKEIAEVKAKMILARNFPRDIDYCISNIMRECQSKRLAEIATYEYPKGDTVIKGASIRLIEVVSRHWGNMLSGVKEIARNGSKSIVKAYAWDLESNYADEKIFEVELIRNTKKGSYALTDERDKYEMIANMGARRKRACIQAVIPGYVIDEAVEECAKTLEQSLGKGEQFEETKKKMLAAFKELADWITPEMVGGIVNKEFDKITQKELVKIRNLYNAIKDGFVKAEEAFKIEKSPEMPSVEESSMLDDINEGLFGGNKNA